ncbi:MAG TPA: type IV pilus biogenesis/stability protein PilW [Gammaproteobacteria bacterium]|nr:type IV pilus biogenesis/stability protein PilW [Gammaproteobacteria bacterium]
MIKPIKIIIAIVFCLQLASCTTASDKPPDRAPSPVPDRPAQKANLKEASQLNVQLAVGYIHRKQYEAARDKLEKAIEQNPENLEAYKTLAYLYALLGLTDKAEEKYQDALDIKPDDSDLLNNYGAFLCSIGKVDEALEALKKAYSNPFYKGVYLAQSNAGSCYLQLGKYDEAEKLLRKSLRIEPKLPGSLISMAEIGVKTGRYMMARAYIQRYHAVSKPTPASLWIQIQAEKALGAKDHYMKYARQLIQDFPDSDEAGWVEAEARNEPLR